MAKRKAQRKTPKVANPWHDLTTEEAMQGVTLTDANGRQVYPPPTPAPGRVDEKRE